MAQVPLTTQAVDGAGDTPGAAFVNKHGLEIPFPRALDDGCLPWIEFSDQQGISRGSAGDREAEPGR